MNSKCDHIRFILLLHLTVKEKNTGAKNALFDAYGYNINVLLLIYRLLTH